jgi:MerR family transcriptional regulator/heat shock protein HspR
MSAREHPDAHQHRADAAGNDGRAPAIGPGGSAVDPAPGALTDPDVPLYSVGQVCELLGIAPAALRRLDQQGALRPGRSDGNQRRYTRRQIQRIQRLAQLLGEGLPITAAHRIAELEDQVRRLSGELAQATTTRKPRQ